MTQSVSISIIVPVYSGEDYLDQLALKIDEVREEWSEASAPFEIAEAIFVNDASIDGSFEILGRIERRFPWAEIVNLSRNFGQHQATVAGILHCSGDWVITIDEDLQHDPEHFEVLLKRATTGEFDVVYARPESAVHESFFRDRSSRLYKKIVSLATGNEFVPLFNSFRLIRGSIARASSSVCTHGTYFDISLGWFTDRVSCVDLPLKDKRYAEKTRSGYSFKKLLNHARRMIVSSETKLIRLGAIIGFIAMTIAAFIGIKILVLKLIVPESVPVQGWTSLFLALLFFGGLTAILLGIILEYLSVILLHIQGKPTFFVVDRERDSIIREYFLTKKNI